MIMQETQAEFTRRAESCARCMLEALKAIIHPNNGRKIEFISRAEIKEDSQ